MQVLANRPDIMREDYMNELCTLQDDVPSFANKVRASISMSRSSQFSSQHTFFEVCFSTFEVLKAIELFTSR